MYFHGKQVAICIVARVGWLCVGIVMYNVGLAKVIYVAFVCIKGRLLQGESMTKGRLL